MDHRILLKAQYFQGMARLGGRHEGNMQCILNCLHCSRKEKNQISYFLGTSYIITEGGKNP
jgi:hypothetical protein